MFCSKWIIQKKNDLWQKCIFQFLATSPSIFCQKPAKQNLHIIKSKYASLLFDYLKQDVWKIWCHKLLEMLHYPYQIHASFWCNTSVHNSKIILKSSENSDILKRWVNCSPCVYQLYLYWLLTWFRFKLTSTNGKFDIVFNNGKFEFCYISPYFVGFQHYVE